LHIDNRNLEFDGDAVSAQDGCEIHITNSHISATGVGVTARHANVHIDNSLIEGDAASIDASDGAQVYAASSRFRGLSRRADTAAFRSEEHTSELQSLRHLVCRLLLEKKKNKWIYLTMLVFSSRS